ncbi:MAG: hypothetical protein KA757_03565 [Vogesella sp.]|nr:hypothetical protein [Vogesella sp.]
MPARLKLFLLGLLIVAGTHASPVLINYPILPAKGDPQLHYMLSLLKLACNKAAANCLLRPGPAMVQGRAIQELQRKQSRIDVMWTMTSHDRERLLLPIRIPLDKGLIGWRIALVPPGKGHLLADVNSLKALARFTAGQEHDWPDTAILQAAGLPVVSTPDYEPLFSMLAKHRFDYFPRSVIEILDEQQTHAGLQLEIDPYLLLHYPTAFYFFVTPNRPKLAQMIRQGLEQAVSDGSFDTLFQQYHGDKLRALKLDKRQIIRLANPLLPPETPLTQKNLWYQP